MTVAELQWLTGVSVTVVVAIAGIAIGAFRSMAGRLDRAVERLSMSIKDGDKELATAMKEGDDKLHERINRVRDEYVPRRELDDHMKRIDATLGEIRTDQKKMLQAVTATAARIGVSDPAGE